MQATKFVRIKMLDLMTKQKHIFVNFDKLKKQTT